MRLLNIAFLVFVCYTCCMMEEKRYRKLNEYYKEKFGERTLKICIDGGFTCPNRDGTSGIGGCLFCSEHGSGEHLDTISSIKNQVKNYLNSYRATRANKFIAYFQSFTNTYDTIAHLKKKYDAALIDDRIVGLSVATRPDCIDASVVNLLKSYSDKYYVCVELGLQTANDVTGKTINRGYTSAQFSKAVALLNACHIDVIAHIMVGLPHETEQDIQNTVDFINQHNIQGLKIHSTYVIENTGLADMYEKKEYVPITLDYYIEQAVFILTHISPDIVIHRISGDAPKDILVAPAWNAHKKWIMNGIHKKLKDLDLVQGQF